MLMSVPAYAEYIGPMSAPSSPTANTGRRGGCNGESATELTVLAPQSHVGQTVSSHPTLAWYVPEATPTPLEVYIYDITDREQRSLTYKAELTSTPGIMTLPLPEEHIGLEVGHRYVWQVVLLCNPNRPSGALITSTELEVVPHSIELDNQLRQLNETEYTDLNTLYRQRSEIYAEAGIWYDAFADALYYASIGDRSSLFALLNDLNAIETAGNAPNDSLSSVIDAIRSE